MLAVLSNGLKELALEPGVNVVINEYRSYRLDLRDDDRTRPIDFVHSGGRHVRITVGDDDWFVKIDELDAEATFKINSDKVKQNKELMGVRPESK